MDKKAHLNIISIQVKSVVFIIKNLGRILVPSITGHVICQHKYYPLIRYSKSLNRPVNQKKADWTIYVRKEKKII